MHTVKTLFQKIAEGEIPAEFVYKDDLCFAIRDISPQAPVHVLIIPRKPVPRVSETTEEDVSLLGHLIVTAGEIARRLGLQAGFRLVVNNGKQAGETVPHLHVHLLAGREMSWPPG
ncbi:MAG: histidine triad nucleotide-binding protein [Puniceicoccales bacterium]|jgi:histidine triad (HIT) family protein|nr:histidine triad nucleotide-binding protein [Puniceicoccales bacterium]